MKKYLLPLLMLLFIGCSASYPRNTIDGAYSVQKPFIENKVVFINQLESEEGLIVYNSLEKAFLDQWISVTKDISEASLFVDYSLTGFIKNNVVSDNVGNMFYKNYIFSYKIEIKGVDQKIKYEIVSEYENDKRLNPLDALNEFSENLCTSLVKKALTKFL